MLGFYLLMGVPAIFLILIPFAVTGFNPQGNEMVFGIGILVALLVVAVMWIIAWPTMYLIVDKHPFREALSIGMAIGSKNAILTIPLFLVAYIAGMSGIIACFVGVIATVSLIHTILATGYLNMSGQLKSPR